MEKRVEGRPRNRLNKEPVMITIEKWAGLITNASPYSIPPGSAVTQVNIQAVAPGQIQVRMGYTTVSLSQSATSVAATTAQVLSMIRYNQSSNENIIVHLSNGSLIRRVIT